MNVILDEDEEQMAEFTFSILNFTFTGHFESLGVGRINIKQTNTGNFPEWETFKAVAKF